MITIFKSMNSHDVPEYYDISDVLARIRRGNNRSLINKIRAESNKQERDRLKKQLLWILFSGKFRARLNDELIQHSGFICLDFDGMPDNDLRRWRQKLMSNKHTFALFTSPSGNGLKVLWKIPPCQTNDEHNRRFEAISKEFTDCQYFDHNVKGVARVCFESYDSDLYHNPKSEVFLGIEGQIEAAPKPAVEHREILTDTDIIFRNLITWFEKAGSLRKGNRDAGAFMFAAAVADYIPQSEGWQLAYNYISQNVEQDSNDPFTTAEIEKCINQAYRTNPFPKKKMNISGEDLPNVDDSILEILGPVDIDTPREKKTVFWRRNTRGGYDIDYFALKQFLQKHGYYRHDFNQKDFEFIKIDQQTVEPVGVRHIKDFVLGYLEQHKEQSVYNMIAGNSKFKKDYLDLLDAPELTWNRDTKDTSWVYYDDVAVKVTAAGIEVNSYMDLTGYIWKSQKKARTYETVPGEGDACQFIKNICGGDAERIKSMKSAIGYLLHGYKSYSTSPAVILTDEIISNEPNGGSGKGLTLKMIGHIRKLVIIDGKSFNTGKNFVWQRVGLDTKIIQIDDIPRNFDFEKLFSLITEGVPVEKKNMDEIYIDFSDSPKFVINTNIVLKGEGASHQRRKFELEIANHYNAGHQPIDDFHREFFIDWDTEEWLRFDNFMIGCLHFYLQNGLIRPTYVNFEIKKFIRETCQEFYEFAQYELQNNQQYHKLKMLDQFKTEQGRKGDYPTKTQFTKWMRKWGEFNGWEITDGGGGRGYMIFGKPDNMSVQGYAPF